MATLKKYIRIQYETMKSFIACYVEIRRSTLRPVNVWQKKLFTRQLTFNSPDLASEHMLKKMPSLENLLAVSAPILYTVVMSILSLLCLSLDYSQKGDHQMDFAFMFADKHQTRNAAIAFGISDSDVLLVSILEQCCRQKPHKILSTSRKVHHLFIS